MEPSGPAGSVRKTENPGGQERSSFNSGPLPPDVYEAEPRRSKHSRRTVAIVEARKLVLPLLKASYDLGTAVNVGLTFIVEAPSSHSTASRQNPSRPSSPRSFRSPAA